MPEPLSPPTLAEIRAAAERLPAACQHTPLVRLDRPGPGGAEIHLKLETRQPIGSFKVRGAGNAMALADPELLRRGVYTASAGNMAQGMAWHARRLGVPCAVVVPDHAPQTKLDAIDRLGAEIVKVPFDEWWRVIVEHGFEGLDGHFIHPVREPAVVAGNGTIGLEVVEELPEVDTIFVPYGGGGLSCGIAAAVRELRRKVRVVAAEVSTAAPLSAALAAGEPVEVDYEPSFVDGIGGHGVLAEMWPMARSLLAGAAVCSPVEIAAAVRLLAERQQVVAEGAGATSVAAALKDGDEAGTVVCVVSGGNIDEDKLAAILRGEVPE